MVQRKKKALPIRRLNSHKGDYGHVLILAGSLGLSGAAYLTSQAVLLSGSGLITLGIPKSLNPIMEVKLTEVMTQPLAETNQVSLSFKALSQIKKILPKIDALAIGPGLAQHPQTKRLVYTLLSLVNKPTVVDADGINALVGKLKVLQKLPAEVVLTPHPGEMSRLLKVQVAEIQKNRSKIAKEFAQRHRVVLVLKGHHSVVAGPGGKLFINKTGNPGMASGGCGDVLTGIIAAFLGQGIDTYTAARLAVYAHGLAADLAAKEKGQISLKATDLLDKLPEVLKTIS